MEKLSSKDEIKENLEENSSEIIVLKDFWFDLSVLYFNVIISVLYMIYFPLVSWYLNGARILICAIGGGGLILIILQKQKYITKFAMISSIVGILYILLIPSEIFNTWFGVNLVVIIIYFIGRARLSGKYKLAAKEDPSWFAFRRKVS